MTFPKLAVQESYGRIGTGNDEMGYQTPTRRENNAQEALKTEGQAYLLSAGWLLYGYDYTYHDR